MAKFPRIQTIAQPDVDPTPAIIDTDRPDEEAELEGEGWPYSELGSKLEAIRAKYLHYTPDFQSESLDTTDFYIVSRPAFIPGGFRAFFWED